MRDIARVQNNNRTETISVFCAITTKTSMINTRMTTERGLIDESLPVLPSIGSAQGRNSVNAIPEHRQADQMCNNFETRRFALSPLLLVSLYRDREERLPWRPDFFHT